MYYLVFFLLFFLGIAEVNGKKMPIGVFNVVYLLMTLIAIFRFGQLGDYFNYYMNYEHPELLLRDPLFMLYVMLFKLLDLDYIIFVAATELICMGMAYPFFKNTCKGSLLALFVFYCYTYLVCPMSAMRQAICLSLLLFSYDLLIHNKKIFYIIAIIGVFIHASFLFVLIIPFLIKTKFFNKQMITWLVVVFAILAFLSISLFEFLSNFYTERSYTEFANSNNFIQMVLRLVLIIPVLFIKPQYGTAGYYSKAICVMGFILYCCLSGDILTAGRIEYYYRTFLCLFVAYISQNMNGFVRKPILSLFIVVHFVLFFKNIGGFIEQGNYKTSITVMNFPYISIFDKTEIDTYANIEKYGYEN